MIAQQQRKNTEHERRGKCKKKKLEVKNNKNL
jgi:hypothetical protein